MTTTNYDWVLPAIGSVGGWGTALNEIIGGTGTPLGIDGVLKGISDDVGEVSDDVDALDVRVTALEDAGASESFYARIYRSSNQSIPASTPTKVSFDATSFDQGSLVSSGTLVVPVSGDGVYMVRAQIEGGFHISSDNARQWILTIRKNGTVVATARTPALNDGAFSSGGDITLAVEYLDPAAVEGDIYSVYVTQSSGTPQLTGTTDATFFEAVRLIAA